MPKLSIFEVGPVWHFNGNSNTWNTPTHPFLNWSKPVRMRHAKIWDSPSYSTTICATGCNQNSKTMKKWNILILKLPKWITWLTILIVFQSQNFINLCISSLWLSSTDENWPSNATLLLSNIFEIWYFSSILNEFIRPKLCESQVNGL